MFILASTTFRGSVITTGRRTVTRIADDVVHVAKRVAYPYEACIIYGDRKQEIYNWWP